MRLFHPLANLKDMNGRNDYDDSPTGLVKDFGLFKVPIDMSDYFDQLRHLRKNDRLSRL